MPPNYKMLIVHLASLYYPELRINPVLTKITTCSLKKWWLQQINVQLSSALNPLLLQVWRVHQDIVLVGDSSIHLDLVASSRPNAAKVAAELGSSSYSRALLASGLGCDNRERDRSLKLDFLEWLHKKRRTGHGKNLSWVRIPGSPCFSSMLRFLILLEY